MITATPELIPLLERILEHEAADGRSAPADPEEIAAFEATIGAPLPADYRAFLAWADGWHAIQDDLFLVSMEEALSDEFDEVLDELAGEVAARGASAARLVAYRTQEDTAFVLLVGGGRSWIVEAHQGLFSDEEGLTALMAAFAEDLLG